MPRYRVTGRNPYRGYKPGEILIGELEPASAARAIAIGAIELVDDEPISLKRSKVTAPEEPASEPAPDSTPEDAPTDEDGGSD